MKRLEARFVFAPNERFLRGQYSLEALLGTTQGLLHGYSKNPGLRPLVLRVFAGLSRHGALLLPRIGAPQHILSDSYERESFMHLVYRHRRGTEAHLASVTPRIESRVIGRLQTLLVVKIAAK